MRETIRLALLALMLFGAIVLFVFDIISPFGLMVCWVISLVIYIIQEKIN